MNTYIKRLLLLSLTTFCALFAMAQNMVTVKGVVLDDIGESIIGATVIVKNDKTIGTVTDIDGKFTLKAPVGATLVVSFMGLQQQEVKVTAANKPLSIVLADKPKEMEEVVIVGYGEQKKVSVIGAITQTTGKVLERAGGVSSVGAALTGNLPGVSTVQSTGMP